MSGIQYKIEQQIIRKFRNAGAISKEKAVTLEKADLEKNNFDNSSFDSKNSRSVNDPLRI